MERTITWDSIGVKYDSRETEIKLCGRTSIGDVTLQIPLSIARRMATELNQICDIMHY